MVFNLKITGLGDIISSQFDPLGDIYFSTLADLDNLFRGLLIRNAVWQTYIVQQKAEELGLDFFS